MNCLQQQQALYSHCSLGQTETSILLSPSKQLLCLPHDAALKHPSAGFVDAAGTPSWRLSAGGGDAKSTVGLLPVAFVGHIFV